MNLSVGGYSFFNTMQEGKIDVFGYMETMKYRYRLDTADLWNGQFCHYRDGVWRLPEDSVLVKIREGLNERGLKIANVAVDGAHLWDPDPDKRQMLRENALLHLKAGAMLGAPTVRIDTGCPGQNAFNDEQFEAIVAGYQEYCKVAEEYGMVIGPENHMGPSLVPGEMKRLAEAVDRPNFGILLHMGRWNEDKENGDGMVVKYAYHTHLDPSVVSSPGAADKVKLLKENGYACCWSVEYNAKGNQYVEVEWLLAGLKKLLADRGDQ